MYGTLLGITATEFNPVNQAAIDEKQRTVIILICFFVTAFCILAAKLFPDLGSRIKEKKKDAEKKRLDKKRDEELERLHRIKEKNKRR